MGEGVKKDKETLKKTTDQQSGGKSWPGFKKGESGNPSGRPKGTPNKLTISVKTAIEEAFGEVGGAAWLVGQAREKPEVFANLLGKIIPKEIKIDLNSQIAVLTEEQKVQLAKTWGMALGVAGAVDDTEEDE